MDPFIGFLGEVKHSLGIINNHKGKIRVIMGNESCDLDSMISSLALGYFWSKKDLSGTLIIPVLNIPSTELDLRTENCYVLKKFGIDVSNLVFRDNLNLEKLQNKKQLAISLVDHHMLSSELQFLKESVVEVFDHRPKDPYASWDTTGVKIRLEEVGSCCTLIADEILNSEYQSLTGILNLLLQYVIIFDTIAFNEEAGKVKDLDIKTFGELSKQTSLEKEPQLIFNELWVAHNDVSHLTPKQLLLKDLKIVEGIPIPGLPMLVEDFLTLPNVLQDMVKFCEEKKASFMIIIGLHTVEVEGTSKVFRDVAIFNRNNDKIDLINMITLNLKSAFELRGYDFQFEEVFMDISGVRFFKQGNIKLTRKHILPLIKDSALKYRSNT